MKQSHKQRKTLTVSNAEQSKQHKNNLYAEEIELLAEN